MRVGDKVRVTTAPWAGELGTIESIDGAYHVIRFDTSEHPDDVKELHPNEFDVILLPIIRRREAVLATRKLYE